MERFHIISSHLDERHKGASGNTGQDRTGLQIFFNHIRVQGQFAKKQDKTKGGQSTAKPKKNLGPMVHTHNIADGE